VLCAAVATVHGQALPQAGTKAQTKTKPAKPRTSGKSKPAAPTAAPEPPPPPPPPPSDVKIVTSYTRGAQVYQNTTYLTKSRQRVEFPGMVTLEQCDLQRTVMLNPAVKRFRVQEAGAPAQPTAAPAPSAGPPTTMPDGMPGLAQAMGGPGAPPRGGVVTLTTTLTDTLERQTLFGLDARHIRTTITKQSSATACDKTPARTEIDAWYVDLPTAATGCSKPAAQPDPPAPASGECVDRVETKTAGDATLGFPVKTTITITTGEADKQDTTTTSSEVTALEITRLDPTLFEVPSDYVAATSSAELVPAVATGASLDEALFGSTADGTGQAAPKKPGVIRIGVLEPVNKSARTLNTHGLREALVSKFKGPYEALPLAGSSAASIDADAARLQCDYILLAELNEVKTSKPGKIGGMLKAASGGGPSKDVQNVKATYRLYAAGATASPRASGDVKVTSGGFGVGSALKMAAFVGEMYSGMGMVRMMRGSGLGMAGLDPISAVLSSTGVGAKGFGYSDPRSMAMNAAMSTLTTGLGGPSGMSGTDAEADADVLQTVSESFERIAKAATTTAKPGPASH
jgi:hypothetical protein